MELRWLDPWIRFAGGFYTGGRLAGFRNRQNPWILCEPSAPIAPGCAGDSIDTYLPDGKFLFRRGGEEFKK